MLHDSDGSKECKYCTSPTPFLLVKLLVLTKIAKKGFLKKKPSPVGLLGFIWFQTFSFFLVKRPNLMGFGISTVG